MTLKLEINLSNKTFFTILLLTIIGISALTVIAYNTGKHPSVMGHSGEEIEVFVNGELKLLNEALEEISAAGNIQCRLQIQHQCQGSGICNDPAFTGPSPVTTGWSELNGDWSDWSEYIRTGTRLEDWRIRLRIQCTSN